MEENRNRSHPVDRGSGNPGKKRWMNADMSHLRACFSWRGEGNILHETLGPASPSADPKAEFLNVSMCAAQSKCVLGFPSKPLKRHPQKRSYTCLCRNAWNQLRPATIEVQFGLSESLDQSAEGRGIRFAPGSLNSRPA